MHPFQGHRVLVAGFILLTLQLRLHCGQGHAIERQDPPKRSPKHGPALLPPIDSKVKLVGFNHALNERLQRARNELEPLQVQATQLQRRFDGFQRVAHGTVAQRKQREGLLREARRLRTVVERKMQDFEPVERRYRSMRLLLVPSTSGLPRAWFDRDTERQMELNERIYKNIIDLLVHLIECPVNIIHDMVGPSPAPPTPSEPTNNEDETTQDLPEDVEPADGTEHEHDEPWLGEFHY
ncbi:uncharacterized protein LOC128721799 [Anopheles nili]|uniref:uncharacterized protein LOC128721799 n=1 Tax=Anopheles nili TaxID=185578 RepID=UPI00237C4F3A|nr:uncharacterized protein LOC128721799 [Anopheles nili]